MFGEITGLHTPAHWLTFMALSSVLLLVGTGYIRLSGGAGIIVGIASAARSFVLKKQAKSDVRGTDQRPAQAPSVWNE